MTKHEDNDHGAELAAVPTIPDVAATETASSYTLTYTDNSRLRAAFEAGMFAQFDHAYLRWEFSKAESKQAVADVSEAFEAWLAADQPSTEVSSTTAASSAQKAKGDS